MNNSSPSELEDERIESEARSWVQRLCSGEMNEGDVAAFDRWHGQSPAHSRAFAEANLLWDVLGRVAREADARGTGKSALRQVRAQQFARRAVLAGGLSACAAYIAFRPPLRLWPSIGELTATYRTGTGERRQLALASGITVDMNTQTSVGALVTSAEHYLLELISGQVAISIQQNAERPLLVAAGDGHVRAQRAEFDLRHEGARVSVTCSAGTVDLSCRSNEETIVAGHQATYDEARFTPSVAVNLTAVTAWREGLLIFRDVALEDVVAELNRYRKGRIVLVNKALAERKVVAGFRLDQIDGAIDYLHRAFGIQVRVLPGGITLLS